MSLQPILTGYDRPDFVGYPPGNKSDMYVAEQSGRIWIASKTAEGWERVALVADLTSDVLGYEQQTCWPQEFNDERGLLGLTFAADFATSKQAFVAYTRDAPCDSLQRGAMIVAAVTLGDPAAVQQRHLLSIDKPVDQNGRPRPNHQGGGLGFGPDGLLYIGLGEGGPGGGQLARNLGSYWGKILRIDPNDPDGDGPLAYSVPADNPYVAAGGALPEIWATGTRNPWRWSFDSANGDLWLGDVGQFRYESIDVAPANADGRNAAKGLNFGWSRCEGAHRFDGSKPGDPEPAPCDSGALPVYEYEHSDGRCSVIGGVVYRGQASPAWDGTYFFSDFCDGTIRALVPGGIVAGPSAGSALTFGVLADGELVVASADGNVEQIHLNGSPS